MGNCLLLDAQQIASILHDYFAEHAAELFQDECAAALESYLVLDRGNVRAVCAFGGDDAIIDWQRVIDKLPHGGDRAFVLRTEELRALGKGNAKRLRRDVRFAQRKATALPPEYVRLMTWNEVELKEMLLRQLFDFVGQHFTFRPDMFHAGMWRNLTACNRSRYSFGEVARSPFQKKCLSIFRIVRSRVGDFAIIKTLRKLSLHVLKINEKARSGALCAKNCSAKGEISMKSIDSRGAAIGKIVLKIGEISAKIKYFRSIMSDIIL